MTPAERAEQSAMMEAELERYLHLAELRKLRKERTTPEQRARKAAQDDARKLRALLREAAEANQWARIETALDGFAAFECRRKANALRDKVKQRTARVYARAAAGCDVSAAYLADDSTDALYAEAFNEPAAPVQQ
jgi:hypothetical protein